MDVRWQSSQPAAQQAPPTQARTLLSRGSQVRVLPGRVTRYAGHRARQSSGSVANSRLRRSSRTVPSPWRPERKARRRPAGRANICGFPSQSAHPDSHVYLRTGRWPNTPLCSEQATVYGQVWHPLTSHEPMTGEHFVRLACKLSHRPYGLQVPPRWTLALSSARSFRSFARTWRCSTSSSTTTGSSIVGKIRTGIWADGHGLPRRHRDRPGTLSKLRSGKRAACSFNRSQCADPSMSAQRRPARTNARCRKGRRRGDVIRGASAGHSTHNLQSRLKVGVASVAARAMKRHPTLIHGVANYGGAGEEPQSRHQPEQQRSPGINCDALVTVKVKPLSRWTNGQRCACC